MYIQFSFSDLLTIGVEFTDPQNDKVTTANQETWITTDGGQSWQSR